MKEQGKLIWPDFLMGLPSWKKKIDAYLKYLAPKRKNKCKCEKATGPKKGSGNDTIL